MFVRLKSTAHRSSRLGPRLAQVAALSTLCALGLTLLVLTGQIYAAQITLTWNDLDNDPADVGGYTLYYWQATGQTPARLDVGKQFSYTLTGLEAGQSYSFAVTVHDVAGCQESAYSNMVISRTRSEPTDLNGDGKADLVWHHAPTGAVAVWLMDGPGVLQGAVVGQVPDLGWQIVGVGDLNGDGKADLVWHHAPTGAVAVWLMDGPGVLQGAVVGQVPDLGWQIQ